MRPFALFVRAHQQESRRLPRALRTRRSARPATSETYSPATRDGPFRGMCIVRSSFFVILQIRHVLFDRLSASLLVDIDLAVAEQILYVNHLYEHDDHGQQ